jgi:uncharacterized protein DUF397
MNTALPNGTAGHRVDMTEWRKATRSDSGGNCVEVSHSSDNMIVGVRDSKDSDSPVLCFDGPAWRRFTAAVYRGAFDRLDR